MQAQPHGGHKMATCSNCNNNREARTINTVSGLCRMCTMKVNQGKTLVSQSGSGKSISNFGGDEEEDNDNLNYDHDYSQKIGDNADGSFSQIGEKRTRKEAGLKVDEDDLGAYRKNSTATKDVVVVIGNSASKGIQQQQTPAAANKRQKLNQPPANANQYLSFSEDTPM